MLLFSLNPVSPDSWTLYFLVFLIGAFVLGFAIAYLLYKSGESAQEEIEGDAEDFKFAEEVSYEKGSEELVYENKIHGEDEAVHSEQLENARAEIARIQTECQGLRDELIKCRETSGARPADVSARINELQLELAEAEKINLAADTRCEHKLSELKVQMGEMETNILSYNSALSVIASNYGIYFDNQNPSLEELESLTEQVKGQTQGGSKPTSVSQKLKDLNLKYRALVKEAKELRSENGTLKSSNSDLEGKLDDCRNQLNTAETSSGDQTMPLGLATGEVIGAPAAEEPVKEKRTSSKGKTKAKEPAEETPVKRKRGRKPSIKSRDEVLAGIREKRSLIDYDTLGIKQESDKEDLKVIKGIGPWIEQKLNALDIYTYEQISHITEEMLDTVINAIEYFPGRVRRDDWVGQATALAKHDHA